MAVCAVCGSRSLALHLPVAGDLPESGLIPTTDRFGTALGDIFLCRGCGHRQLVPMPQESELERAYGEAASLDYVEEAVGQRETARRTLAQIERHVAPGRLLDIGCWVGFLLAEARARGWVASGIEPSHFAATQARERFGVEVVESSLFDVELAEGAYSAVTLGDVIEHLPRPAEALERIHAGLAEGGVLWLALPDAGSGTARLLGRRWWSVIPTHVQYFTRGSLTLLLERTGLEVLELGTAPKAFTVSYYLGRIGGYSPPLARGAQAAAQAIGVAERIWAPDFRDRIYVIARKA